MIPAAALAAAFLAHGFAVRDLTRAFTLLAVAAALGWCAWTLQDGWTTLALAFAYAAGRTSLRGWHNLRHAWTEHRLQQWCHQQRRVMRGHVAQQRIGGKR